MVGYKYSSEAKMELIVNVVIVQEWWICVMLWIHGGFKYIYIIWLSQQRREITRAVIIMFDRQQNQNHELIVFSSFMLNGVH